MFGKKTPPAEIDVNQLVAENDAGGRSPGPLVARLLLFTTLAWSLFQLWIASPLPFVIGIGVFNDTQSRAIHLAFAIFLAFLAYPAFKRSPRSRVPATDWVFALVGAFCASYIFFFYRELSTRPGQPTTTDLVVAATGIVGGLVSPPYSAAANVDPGATGSPLVVTTGSVVKFVSRLTGLPTNNRPAGNDMVVLTVVDAIPASDAIRPGVSRGGSKASAIRLSDFNLDVFQNLPPTPNAPTFAQALDWVDRYHEVSQPDSINNTRTKGINNHREYGRDIGNDLHRAMLCLHLSSLTVGQKRTLLSHLATIADDLISRAEEGSVTLGAGGGNQWKLPVIYVCAASLGAKTPASWAIHLGSAQRFNWAENSQVFTVQGTDTAMPRLSTDGRPRAMYTPQMIGTADWGEQHSLAPQNSGANWNAFYRDIVAYSLLPGVLAVELTAGAKALWNYPALWLYFDTVFGRRNEGGTGNQALPFTLEMVNAYRPAKTAAPEIVEAGVRGVDLWLRFDQSLLDNVNAPAPTAFTILVGGSPRAAVAAQVFRQNIGLTLVSPVLGSDVVSISYNLPGANPVRSVDGVNVASFTDLTVLNRTEKIGGTNSAFPIVRFAPGVVRRLAGSSGAMGTIGSAVGTMALLRFQFPAAPGADAEILGNQSGALPFRIFLTSSRRFEIRLATATGALIARAQTPILAINTAYDILWSWDVTQSTNTAGVNCFVNGASQNLTFLTWSGGASALVGWSRNGGIGATAYAWNFSGTTFDLGAFWLDGTTRLDLTNAAERAKFAPANMQTRGDGINGSVPAHFHVGNAEQWNDTFGLNFGSGNRFYPAGGPVIAVSGSEWI